MNHEGGLYGDPFHRHDDFEFSEPPPDLCPYAAQFSEWVEELISNATQDPNVVSINQSKVLLLDKYFEWKAAVSKAHRNRIGERGHSCIFHVFEAAYQKLKVAELSLTPPMLFLPPSSPPQPAEPKVQVPVLFLGEVEE